MWRALRLGGGGGRWCGLRRRRCTEDSGGAGDDRGCSALLAIGRRRRGGWRHGLGREAQMHALVLITCLGDNMLGLGVVVNDVSGHESFVRYFALAEAVGHVL